MSKLGVYFIGPPDVAWLERAKPSIAFQLLVGSSIDIGQLRAAMQVSPDTLWVLRLYRENQDLAQADAFNQDLLRAIEPFRDLAPMVMGFNEIATNTPDAMAAWARVEVTRTRLLHKNGYKSGGGSSAVGNPPLPSENPAIWTAAFPMLDNESPDSLDALILHEYGYPAMASDDGWECNRYRNVYEWLPARYRKPLIIGECGIDKGDRPPKDGACGWKAVASPMDYMSQLAWYDAGLPKDALAAVYCWGYNGDKQWNSFRIDDSPMAGLLADYLQANPPNYWKGVDMADSLVTKLQAAFGSKFQDKRKTLPQMADLGPTRSRDNIIAHAIHHTAGSATQTVEALAQYFVGLGYEHVAYSIILEGENVVYAVDLGLQSFGVYRKNALFVDIAIIGDYTNTRPTPTQIANLRKVCDVLDVELGRVLPRAGHAELADPRDPTDCPGATSHGAQGWLAEVQAGYAPLPDLATKLAEALAELAAANDKITKAKQALG